SKSPNSWVNSSMANPARPGRVGRTVKRGAGKRIVEGTGFRLADEVRSIQRRAANHDGRIITIGQLVLFSTDTGDAWLLDRSDQLAARLARNGELETVHIEETDTAFSIGWRAAIASTGRRSSTRIGKPVGSSPSLGIRPTKSLLLLSCKFQICLARLTRCDFILRDRSFYHVVGMFALLLIVLSIVAAAIVCAGATLAAVFVLAVYHTIVAAVRLIRSAQAQQTALLLRQAKRMPSLAIQINDIEALGFRLERARRQ